MKRVKHIALVAATVAMASVTGAAFAATVPDSIALTKHNLSSSSSFNGTTGTTEICVFCHTPHGATTAQSVPLWNRNTTVSTAFTTYDDLGSSTLDGTISMEGSVSLACLSCHDGQIAMDSLLNTPGSGTDPAAAALWQFTSASTPATITPEGFLAAGSIAMLGTDLRDDHPVGILYAGGGVDQTPAKAEFKDADFKVPVFEVINGGNYWYVDTPIGTANERTRTDMILYTRQESGIDKPFVECASCHDPHVGSFDTNQVMFLRVSNEGSALCLACHDK